MKQFSQFILILLTTVFLGCEKEKIITLNGDVSGYVNVLDQLGFEIQDKSGVKVTLDESHITTTDATGKFELKDVPVGTYVILFEKEGFGTYKKFYSVVAGGNLSAFISNVYVIQLSPLVVADFSVAKVGTGLYKLSGKFPETTEVHLNLYLGKDATVSAENYDALSSFTLCCIPTTSFEWTIFVSGTSFISIYASGGMNSNGRYNYYSYDLGRSVDPTLKQLIPPTQLQ